MPQKEIIIIGASGHARVCLDILLAVGKKVIGFADDDPSLNGIFLNGYPILGEVREVISKSDKKLAFCKFQSSDHFPVND